VGSPAREPSGSGTSLCAQRWQPQQQRQLQNQQLVHLLILLLLLPLLATQRCQYS
jgi:hypothetical protein